MISQATLAHEAGNLGIADTVNAWGRLQGRHGGSHGLGCVGTVGNQIGHRLAVDGGELDRFRQSGEQGEDRGEAGNAGMRDGDALAKDHADFWQEYKFTDPLTKKVVPKKMYCERLNDSAVCGGVYK